MQKLLILSARQCLESHSSPFGTFAEITHNRIWKSKPLAFFMWSIFTCMCLHPTNQMLSNLSGSKAAWPTLKIEFCVHFPKASGHHQHLDSLFKVACDLHACLSQPHLGKELSQLAVQHKLVSDMCLAIQSLHKWGSLSHTAMQHAFI